MTQVKQDVGLFVMDAPNEPCFMDSEGNKSTTGGEPEFETPILGNGKGKIFFFAGAGVACITDIKIDSGEEVIKSIKKKSQGRYWIVKLKKMDEDAEAKYTICFETEGGTPKQIDPIMKVKGTGGG